jgi:thioredoxin reductase
MAKTEVPRLAILGAGPIGLEVALYAAHLDLPFTIYERGRVGEHVQRWGHVKMFSPFGMNVTPLGLAAIHKQNPKHEFPNEAVCTTGREHWEAYVDPLSKTNLLRELVRTDAQVLSIGRRGLLKEDTQAGSGGSQSSGNSSRSRQPFRLLVRFNKNQERIEEADVVLDCTGTYSQHRWMGDGGIAAVGEMSAEPHIAYGLEDILGTRQSTYAGRNVLVVGAGYSAATTVCNLAALAENHPDTWVYWLARGTGTQPIKRIANDPLKERDRLAVRANTLATRGEGNVEFHSQTVIESAEWAGPDKGFKVTARCGGKPRTWEVERLIANVGFTPDRSLYRELQVHECYATFGPMNLAAALLKQAGLDCLQIPPQGAEALRNPEPNFFILGAKSYGRNSHFLLRNGFEQVREVFTLITGKPELNLYKKR